MNVNSPRTPRSRTVRPSLLALASSSVIGGGIALAGPLTPPAGPVTSTYKTLTEVEPRIAINATNTPGDANSLFMITQPGSYYLTGNITGVAGRHGVEIAASGVTLDLMGFDLSGLPASLDGVSATVSNLTNITVRNGSVRAWGDEGVDLGTNSADNSAVIDVRASGNAGSGITTDDGCTITGCSAYNNTGDGILTGFGCTITGCSATNNSANGIVTSSSCTITACSASSNTGSGISTGFGCMITECTASYNGTGIATDDGCTITGCTAIENTGSGISTGFGCMITECTASFNGTGIATASGCTISNCTARSNTLDGIRVTSGCVVLANACLFNGNGGSGAGIHATSSDNRIEGNNCTGADRGIDVDSAGNIIIKNTCSGNISNWEIAVGNVCLVILATPTVAAISGDSGGLSPGSTNPNANFTY